MLSQNMFIAIDNPYLDSIPISFVYIMNPFLHVFNMKVMSLSVFHKHIDNHSADMDEAEINELHQCVLLNTCAYIATQITFEILPI